VPRAWPAVRSVSWPALRPWALTAILLIAACLRLTGVGWDARQHLHPDERFITMVEDRLLLPAGVDQYFDTRNSPLNPYNRQFGTFVYGTFPLILVRVVAEGLQTVAAALPASPGSLTAHLRVASHYDDVYLLGRVVSGLADVITVWLVYLIGRRLFGSRTGALAALLASFTVLQIQAAHFFTTEAPLTMLCALSIYAGLRVAESNAPWDWALLGASIGLAIATKMSALLLVILVPAVAWIAWYRARQMAPQDPRRNFLFEDLVTGVIIAGFLAAVTFRIAQPYAFSGPGLFNLKPNPQWLADLQSQSKFATGEADYPPSVEWASTPPFIWQLQNMTMWGLGPPLALASFAGLALGAWRLFRQPKRHYLVLLPLLWAAANFLYLGPQFVKPMRYLLPIYPVLVIFAAHLLVSALRAARWKQVSAALLVVVAGYTAFYGTAFASIYTRPNSRVVASQWIFDHIPPGSHIGVEHWDDPLPLRVDGKDAFAIYKGVELPMYDPDNAQKRTTLLNKLDEADLIVLSSDRVYGSILRMPLRYPLSVRYYQALFSGELGFDKVAEFTSRPRLFGIEIRDDDAEELFVNYEHAKVLIFRKGPSYSHERAASILDSVALDQAVTGLLPKDNRSRGLFLTEAERAAAEAGGTWSRLFNRSSPQNRVPTLTWWAGLELLGLLAFPLFFAVFRAFFDRGWLLSKTGGLLLVAYLSWIPPSLHWAQSTRGEVALGLLALAILGAAAGWLQREQIAAAVREHWPKLVFGEVLFLALFAFFVTVRSSNPDLWHAAMGGEKPMDFAYLNATIKSAYFPPYDPWFAGGYINYYYFGFVIVAALTKLLAIVPATAYNLAVATLPALACAGAFSIVATLAGWSRLRTKAGALSLAGAGLFGAVTLGVAGNVGDVPLLSSALGAMLSGQPPGFRIEWWYWNATRVIPDAINEFPYFTFLYGDLHAHAIALPLQALAIGAITAIALKATSRAGTAVTLALLGLILGALRATNTWDFPTYLLVGGAALLLAEATSGRGLVAALGRAGLKLAIVVALSSLFFAPFTSSYATLYSSIKLWTGQRTSFGQYLEIHALFLALIVFFLAYQLGSPGSGLLAGRLLRLCWRFRQRCGRLWPRLERVAPACRPTATGMAAAAGLIVLLGAALLARHMALLFVLSALLIATTVCLLSPGSSQARRLTNLLICTGLALSIAVDVIVLSGDVGRMNTVFKLDFQVWALWSVAGAVALFEVLSGLKPSQSVQRQIVGGTTAALLACGLVYTAAGSMARAHDRFTQLPRTLDGEAFMPPSVWLDKQPLPLRPDYEAIHWLEDNVQGSPVILEGRGRLYSWANRVSIYTGLPTVLGWDWHETQQRGVFAAGQIEKRAADVTEMYSNASLDLVLPLLREYHVRYIYVGPFERETYPEQGLAKFENGPGLSLVYDRDGVKIWEVL
jgi:YYY domain-containing protein